MYKIKHLNNCTSPTLTFLLQMTIKKCQLYHIYNDIGSTNSNIRNLEEISMHESSEFITVTQFKLCISVAPQEDKLRVNEGEAATLKTAHLMVSR